EDEVRETLEWIRARLLDDLGPVGDREEMADEEAIEVLAAAEAWASLASAVVFEFSLTQEPRDVGAAWWRSSRPPAIWPGWRKDLTRQLHQVADSLRPALTKI